jgi:xylulokinase
MEGVAYGMRDSLELVKGLGTPIRQIRVSGGGGKSPFWRQLMADVFGAKVVTINASEGPAFGVALLAAVGTGKYKDIATACAKTISLVEQANPDKKAKATYDRMYPEFGALYRALKPEFSAIAKLVT